MGGSGLWQDVQGVMRLTVVSGAVDLSGMKVEVLGGPFDPFGHHVQLVSVPEPSSLLLFGLGMLALYSFSKWRGQGLTMRCSEPGPRALVAIHASRGPGR